MAVQSKIFTVSLFTFEMERAHRVIWCKACKCNGTREHGFRFFWDSTNNFAKCSIFMLGITCWFILDLCMIRFLCFRGLSKILMVFGTLDAIRRTFMDVDGLRWVLTLYPFLLWFYKLNLTNNFKKSFDQYLTYNFLAFYISLNFSFVYSFCKSLVGLLHETNTLYFVFLTRGPLIISGPTLHFVLFFFGGGWGGVYFAIL